MVNANGVGLLAFYNLPIQPGNGAPGVPEDRAGAKAQFEIAAAKGQAGALYNLGVMALGDKAANGFPDFKTAAADFRRAAEAGYGDGAYYMVRVNGRELWKEYRQQMASDPEEAKAHKAPPVASEGKVSQ